MSRYTKLTPDAAAVLSTMYAADHAMSRDFVTCGPLMGSRMDSVRAGSALTQLLSHWYVRRGNDKYYVTAAGQAHCRALSTPVSRVTFPQKTKKEVKPKPKTKSRRHVRALARTRRQAIRKVVGEGVSKLDTISEATGITKGSLHSLMKPMRDSGIIIAEKIGGKTIFRLRDDSLVKPGEPDVFEKPTKVTKPVKTRVASDLPKARQVQGRAAAPLKKPDPKPIHAGKVKARVARGPRTDGRYYWRAELKNHEENTLACRWATVEEARAWVQNLDEAPAPNPTFNTPLPVVMTATTLVTSDALLSLLTNALDCQGYTINKTPELERLERWFVDLDVTLTLTPKE